MQILTAPETESPKKAWFIQNGRSDLAVVKGLFNSLILILYTDLWGFTTVWKEDQGRGQALGRKWKGVGKGFLGEERVYLDYSSDLVPALKKELKSGSEAETAEEC